MAPEIVKTEVEGIEDDRRQILLFLKQLPDSDKKTRIVVLENLLIYTTEHFDR